MPTLAEDLLLLMLDDSSGKPQVDSTRLDCALAGAVFAELALTGRIQVVAGEGLFGRTQVAVLDAAPTGVDVHDAALRLAADKPRRPDQLMSKFSKRLREQLLERLAERGILHRESSRVLGIFPRDRWPAQDATAEQTVRQHLHDVLVVGTTPDERTVALVALLAAIDEAHKLFASDRAERKAVKWRAKELAKDSWVAAAVRKAVQSANASSSAGGVVAATSVTT